MNTPTHMHRRKRQISPRSLNALRLEIDRHLAKGRTLNDIVGWLDIPRSQVDEIIAKTGGLKAA